MQLIALLQLVFLAASVLAHPGEVHERLSNADIVEREFASSKRHLKARNCAASAASYQARRRAKREALQKREKRATSTASADSPHYTIIQNFTCVTAPEVTEGPYYINNEMVRQDLREDQGGLKLVLDIGVLDTTTCQPLSKAFVELWNANATGVYGGYSATLSGGGGGPGGAGGSTPLVRNETFLRGGWPTDGNGIVELTTIYPGFYAGRTAHIHTMVHLNYSTSANGTLVSHSGSLIHVGQFFMDETWNDQVFALSPYSEDTNSRTYNSEDSILAQENSGGNNAFLDLELLTDDISGGLLAYITMGVDSSESYSITNTNYYNSSTTADTASLAAAALF